MASLLFPREERTALAAFEAIFPNYEGSSLGIGAADVDMRAYVLDVMAAYPPRLKNGLRALFWLLDAAALLSYGRSFASLPTDLREGLLLRFYNSRIYYMRYVALMLKAVAALGFFGFPEVRERIGYVKNLNVAPIGVIAAGIDVSKGSGPEAAVPEES